MNEYERFLNTTTRLPSDQAITEENLPIRHVDNDDEDLDGSGKKRRKVEIYDSIPEDEDEQYASLGMSQPPQAFILFSRFLK